MAEKCLPWRLLNGSLVQDPHLRTLHGLHIDFNGHCVMLYFSCGGAAVELKMIADRLELISDCVMIVLWMGNPSYKKGLLKARSYELHSTISFVL